MCVGLILFNSSSVQLRSVRKEDAPRGAIFSGLIRGEKKERKEGGGGGGGGGRKKKEKKKERKKRSNSGVPIQKVTTKLQFTHVVSYVRIKLFPRLG